ncbi:MAG: glycosyltransferase [Clostridium sp.]
MNPEISIIVPVYNVEKYLRRCIDSIINQTFKNFELILIDDGSTDNCLKICNEYAEKDDRIIVIHKNNEGCSVARNKGLKIAIGKYIGFVDSDDTIEPTMYEEMFNLIEKYESTDLVECGFIFKNLIKQKESIILKEKYSPTVWSKLFKKKLINTYNIDFPIKSHMGEDLSFVEKYVCVSRDIKYILKPLYNYYFNKNSVSINFKKRLEIYKSLDDMIKYMRRKKNNNNKLIRKRVLEHGFEYNIEAIKKYTDLLNINLEYFIFIMYLKVLKYMRYLNLEDVIYLLKIITKVYIDRKYKNNHNRL